ncbi:MAG: sulfatase-like hydrolase/transferase [Planctomycetota bacterium]
MKRWTLTAPLLLALLGAPSAAQADGAAPGNILIVLVDDLGKEWLSMYGVGSAPANTPNLDALAANGVTFNNAWSTPMCSPTRAAIQTGRYGFRTGVGHLVSPSYGLPLDEVTLPEMIELGTGGQYLNSYVGKWHLGSEEVGGFLAPNMAGWQHFGGLSPFAGSLLEGEDYFQWTKVSDGTVGVVNEYVTSHNIDDAISVIQIWPDPWLLFVSLVSVHNPYHAPPPSLHGVDLSGAGDPEVDTEPYYRAMIEAMDAEIGRLINVVDFGTTTLIFVADNGSSFQTVFPPFDPLHGKNSLFEGGISVPMIVRGPDVTQPGSICDGLVNVTDVFATAADLADVDLAATLPGVELDSVSFRPYLSDPALPSLRDWIFAEHFQPNGPRGGPLAPKGPSEVCQPDLGFGGPGTATLSFCGPPLVEYALPDLVLTGAQPFSPTFFAVSTALDPIPFFGGTLATNPVALLLPFDADENGEVRSDNLTVPSPGPITLFVQGGALDPSAPLGVTFTNAIQADFLPWDTKAIRNERWKLIADVHAGWHRLYDLETDPLEVNDLIAAGPLDPVQQAAYDSLLQDLIALVDAP